MNRADQLASALDDFLSVSPETEAAAVVSADGLPMASALPPYVEEDRLAAMSAALLTLGERAASGLGKGELKQVFIEGDQGYVVLMAAGANAVLVAVGNKDTKVGLILFEMRRTAARIAEVMEAPAERPAPPPERPAPSWTTPAEAEVMATPAYVRDTEEAVTTPGTAGESTSTPGTTGWQ